LQYIQSATIVNRTYFLFNDSAPPYFYTLSLHDALPISRSLICSPCIDLTSASFLKVSKERNETTKVFSPISSVSKENRPEASVRSEEHTSELQSRENLVCRLLLEKKNTIQSLIVKYYSI